MPTIPCSLFPWRKNVTPKKNFWRNLHNNFLDYYQCIEIIFYFFSEPLLYRGITHNKLFSWKYFIGWMVIAIYHSVIIYSFSYIVWSSNSAIFSSMMVVGFSCFGTFLIHNVVVLVNLKLLIETVYKSYIFIGTIWLSIFGFIGTTFVYNLFDMWAYLAYYVWSWSIYKFLLQRIRRKSIYGL